MNNGLNRLDVLTSMIVEDALKASSDDASIKALAERALTEAKGGLVKDPVPGSWSYIKAVPQEQAAKTECVRAAMAAIVILESLHEAKVKRVRLPQTFKCLYDALAQGFVQADPGELKGVLAKATRTLQTHGLEKEWAAALYEASKQDYDSSAFGKFVAESDKDSNRVAVSKAMQRRASIMEISGQDMSRMLFEARCGHALGRNGYTLHLVEAGIIAHIERMTQLAEWSFSLATWVIHLTDQKTELLYPDTIQISGTLNRYNSTRDSQVLVSENLTKNRERLRERWKELEKPEGSNCTVRLVVDGVPRFINLD
jgi:hypothetical protein